MYFINLTHNEDQVSFFITSTICTVLNPLPSYAIDPGTAIAGASLALQILSGIENSVRGVVRARVDAQADSIGPDADDLYTVPDADEFDGLFGAEWTLDAWTTNVNGTGIELGQNGGSPHEGFARMTAERDFGSAGWRLKDSYAFANAAKDSTPVAGSQNATAVAAVSTFSINGTVQKAWTKVANSFSPTDGSDITGKLSTFIKWSLSSFGAETMGNQTLITPPLASADLGHIFMQLPASPAYRDRYVQLLPTINNSVNILDSKADIFLGTLPFASSSLADLTIAGGGLSMMPMSFLTNERSKLDLVKEYLMSPAVSVVTPGNAQPGYFASASKSLVEDSGLIGLSIDVSGSLTDSLNIAEATPSHPVYEYLNSINLGESIDLELAFSANSSAAAFDQKTAEVPGPIPIFGVYRLFQCSRRLRKRIMAVTS